MHYHKTKCSYLANKCIVTDFVLMGLTNVYLTQLINYIEVTIPCHDDRYDRYVPAIVYYTVLMS